jgi:predicted AlkP superfamily phosphohydrolase/phosphomutase
MSEPTNKKPSRRTFLKKSVIAGAAGAAALGAGSYWLGSRNRVSRAAGTKVIVIGIDGMDPRLSEDMMNEGLLPNLARLREVGGFSRLGTSIPPQSPVAWANFINGAGPGSHGVFDFIHRHPDKQHEPENFAFYGAAETLPGEGGWEVGEHRVQVGNFWPFYHRPATTELRRQGDPFWDRLDEAGVPSTFYDLPCNYPPSPSHHGHHRCLCGMGTPDLLGGFPTFQHFAESGPEEMQRIEGGRLSRLAFEGETARATLVGPENTFLIHPVPATIEFLVHRDRQANAAVVEIQGQRLLLREGQWSRWTKLDFNLSTAWFTPSQNANGICRFYLQKVAPDFRLYASPINIDPSDPVVQISEPASFVKGIAERLGSFPTVGFQEDYSARKMDIFNDDEFARQANMVLEERLALFERAEQDYDDGLLFFYFSSSDLQSHMFWWMGQGEHPCREADEAEARFRHVQRLYQRLDRKIGDIVDRYGSHATILVMSDHGFSDFGRQFHLNNWLRENGYLGPPECTSVTGDADWSQTKAYGLGINGLYINLKGRESNGIVEPGEEYRALLGELKERLEAVEDPETGERVIRSVYRADQVYSGNATALAPDLIVGYKGGYRASWATSGGKLTPEAEFIERNHNAWSADHCVDALEVPGVLFSSRPLRGRRPPALVDVAPSILTLFGLPTPASMVGESFFTT